MHGGYVISNGSTPCPIGDSVGIAVGDYSSGTSHLVDLVPEASTQGQVLQFSCYGAAAVGTIYLDGQSCMGTSSNVTGEFLLPYPSTNTYTLSNMYVHYAAAGNPNDIVTLYVNGIGTLNCQPISGTSCVATSGTASIVGGSTYSIRVATFSPETLANVNVTIQLQ
jgi:hypothetical protein